MRRVAGATAWLDALLKHYGDKEVKILLADVIDHVDAAVRDGVVGPKKDAVDDAVVAKRGGSPPAGPGGGAEGSDDGDLQTRKLEDLVQLLIESCAKFGGASVVLGAGPG